MKNNKFKFVFAVVSLLIILLISFFMPSINKLVFLNRAADNQLNIKIKLQGEYDKITNPVFKTKIILYNQTGPVKEYADQNLTKDNQNIFKLTLDTTGLNLNQMYAVFIKPDKYLGKLFCSLTSYSANCKTPQIVITSGVNTLDLTQDLFFSGDISPQDGKIAADDISKIANQVGKTSTDYLAADINSDGIIQTVDYSLALYSLSKNYVDDPPFTGSAVTPTPTTAENPTATPTQTAIPTPTTAVITPTVTPTVAASGGTCKATINGKIYGNYIISFCSPINNETTSVCVSNASDCTVTNCLNEVITTSKAAISQCTSGGGTIDEAKSRATLSCQVQFTPGNCVPTPTEAINCNEEGPSC